MNKVPDRAKTRRQYLWKKGKIQAGFGIVGILTTVAISISLLILALIVFAFIGGVFDFTGLLIALSYLGTFAIAGLGGIAICKRQLLKAREIAYIPPVHEQVASLPAEEVLLRSSQASAAAPEQLLRPIWNQETPEEELLRAIVEIGPEG